MRNNCLRHNWTIGVLPTALVLFAWTAQAQPGATRPPQPSDAGYQIVERGENHALFRKISLDPATGATRAYQFTLLENGMHYLENGEWRASEDLVESFPGGAVARRGPNKAIFSDELNAETVFDVEASDGTRLRGGVRAVQMTDLSTGESLVVGTVKKSVTGSLLPPNRILYSDAFDGISADVSVVWKHNLFSHDVILRERPELPAGWNPATVRLEVMTEFFVEAEPELRPHPGRANGQPVLEDDVVIGFGSLAMVMGKAFPMPDDNALSLAGGDLRSDGTPVMKEWHRAKDGRRFLIESLNWADAAPQLKDLPPRRQAKNGTSRRCEASMGRTWPERPAALGEPKPIQVASATAARKGYLIDFVIIPSQGTPTTLLSGET